MRKNWLKRAALVGLVGSVGLLGTGVALADPPDHGHEGHDHDGQGHDGRGHDGHDHDGHDHDFHGRDFHDHDFHDHDFRGHDFRGRDFHHFRPEELSLWRGGRWIHDWHGGRFGWWWSVDGLWYFYPQPIYPYPTYVPQTVVTEQVEVQPPAPPPTAQSWYYCDNPRGYYPYIQSCPTPWRSVPAVPPDTGAGPEGAPPQVPYGPPPEPQ